MIHQMSNCGSNKITNKITIENRMEESQIYHTYVGQF